MKAQKFPRVYLSALLLFVGAGAVFGGVCMLLDPMGAATGMSGLLPGLQKLPFADAVFQNLTFSGIMLMLVNGAPQLFAGVCVLKQTKRAHGWALACGCMLCAWIAIQFFIFPLNVLSCLYGAFGLAEIALAILMRKQACAN